MIIENYFTIMDFVDTFDLHLNILRKFFGVKIKLNGGGTVSPSSKYEIQRLVLANFHSVSDLS